MTLSFFRRFLLICAGLTAISLNQSLADEPFFRETDIYEARALLPECYRPSLTVLENGILACAWASGSGMQALDTSIRISFKSSENNGWTEPAVAADEPGYPDNYPLLAKLPDGRLRLIYATLYREKRKNPPDARLEGWHLKYRDSKDGGRIWGGEFFLIPESGRVPSGGMVELPDGGLLLGLTDLRKSGSMFLVSRDKGSYWKDLARIADPSGLLDPSAALAGTGTLLAFLRPQEGSQREKVLWQTESPDNGRSWSSPRKTELLNPCGPTSLLRLANGHLALLYNDHAEWLTPLTIALSEDGGQSWPWKRNLVKGQWDNRDPSLVETADGRLHLVYVARNIYLKYLEISESWIKEKP